jgi:hypothetical protein
VLQVHSASFPNTGPHVDDGVLLNGHREHREALFRVRAAAAEGLQRRLRLPALEDVDTAGVDQVRAAPRGRSALTGSRQPPGKGAGGGCRSMYRAIASRA